MKKVWKIYKYIAITVVTVAVLDLAVVLAFAAFKPKPQEVDAIVVLGAAINTQAAYQRSLEGLKLYQDGYSNLIVLSGGQDYPKSITEAEYMEGVIAKNYPGAIPIILEQESHSTFENLQNVRAKIGADKSILIVSDDYHMARAVLVAERLGFKKVLWAAPSQSYYSKSELAFYYLRECLAMIDYIPKFIFG